MSTNISEDNWRKLLKRLEQAEKNILQMQLLIDRQTSPRSRKTSEQRDKEIQEALLKSEYN